MQKVVRRVINHKYIPYKIDILVEGIIPFDCYIKRFDDYVILIEAGTQLTAPLIEKIRHNITFYVVNHDSQKVKEYRAAYQSQNDISGSSSVKAVMEMPARLAEISEIDKRLRFVYTTVSSMMEKIFDTADEHLPLEVLYTSVKQIAQSAQSDEKIMFSLLEIVPDEYTSHHHSTNVAFFAAVLGSALKLTDEEIVNLTYAGLLHDIGKVKINKNLLLKPERLEDNEYETIKQHSKDGYLILQQNGITNQQILEGVLYHHEKLDGSGYPKHLRGKMIPRFARIIGICDTFDAMTTKRTFRTNYSSFEALMAMRQEMADQYDRDYTGTFIQLLRK